MDKIRAIIADDEPLARRGITQMLKPYPDVSVIAETRNGPETVRTLRELKPDLLFLDVQMPELDGFGVLREIGVSNMPAVIFVTAYDEFAVRAFDVHALDYLVKPLSETRFAQSIELMRERIRSGKAVETSRRLSALLAAHEKERRKNRVVVPAATGDLVLDANEIDWIEADDYYAIIHSRSRRHLVRESLASLEHRLDANRFVRVHRCAIVNLDRVRELHKRPGASFLVLSGGGRVPVSRRRCEDVNEKLRRLTP